MTKTRGRSVDFLKTYEQYFVYLFLTLQRCHGNVFCNLKCTILLQNVDSPARNRLFQNCRQHADSQLR